MVQTKIFPLEKYEEANKFIKTVPVLADGGISFSQGNFIIFYEEGKFEKTEKKAVILREIIDKKAKRIVQEAQHRTYTNRIADLKKQVEDMKDSRKKDDYKDARIVNAIKGQLQTAENMILSIKNEMSRLDGDILGLQAILAEVDDKNSFVAQI